MEIDSSTKSREELLAENEQLRNQIRNQRNQLLKMEEVEKALVDSLNDRFLVEKENERLKNKINEMSGGLVI